MLRSHIRLVLYAIWSALFFAAPAQFLRNQIQVSCKARLRTHRRPWFPVQRCVWKIR